MSDSHAPRKRIEGLDLLRGIAVGLVILQHAIRGRPGYGFGLSSGVVGVVIFFALSGYLITGLLIGDVTTYDTVRYRRFYAHRARRLLPALVAMLAGYLAFSYAFPSLQPDTSPWRGALIGLTYTADLPHLIAMTQSLGHLWSLAVEEQFYLLWPTLLFLAWRRWNLPGFVVLVLVVAELATLIGPVLGRSAFELYYYPTSWSVALVIGAASKIFEARLDLLLNRGARHRAGCVVAVLILVGWSITGTLDGRMITYWLGAPSMAAAGVVIMFWLKHWVVLPHTALRPIWALGVVSYAAYLWNLPISDVVLARHIPPVLAGLLIVTLTFVAATLSWFLLERPVRDWRKRPGATSPGPSGQGTRSHR